MSITNLSKPTSSMTNQTKINGSILTRFQKGHKPTFLKHTQETKEKMRKSALGKIILPAQREKARINATGKKQSEELKIKRGIYKKGAENPNWLGGISINPYPTEFTKTLKLEIRTRDNFTCCLCGKTEREELEELNRVLCVNHIDFNKNNCKKENLNTLCVRCNVKINRERDYWTNYFQTLCQ